MLLASPTVFAVNCSSLETWSASKAYNGGAQVQLDAKAYKANWWSQNRSPAQYSNAYQEWRKLGDCDGGASNQAPSVQLTGPSAGSSVTAGASVVLSATASDPDGSVSKVEFYLDNQLFATDTSAPYSANYTAVAGTHSVFAKATDDKAATSQTATISFTVTSGSTNQVPTVTITAPAANARFNVGETVLLSANATDADGQISKVEFLLNGTLLASKTAAPYTLNWTATAGSQALEVRVTDNQGATANQQLSFSVVSNPTGHAACRPDGLYQTPGLDVPYCSVYDSQGRELLGPDHARRIIGYFTSWRTGKNGQPAYLASNIPWDKVTHINYAFAHVDSANKVSIGNPSLADNAATNMEWPGVTGAEMDPSFGFKGHFNLLNKFKKQHPHVKTLVSIGGWAETGGYFDDSGKRVASGGFYTMTTNADNSVNLAGINTFADSVVAFLRQYGFDGADIDYEYPSSMKDSGNPDDFSLSNARRAGLVASYQVLMKTLREKLDAASVQDGKHYLLTIASPSSGYLLRGMEVFPVTQYLDYVNIMSYDLHGAWNQHVGPNAALFDDGRDSELITWNYYTASQYQTWAI